MLSSEWQTSASSRRRCVLYSEQLKNSDLLQKRQSQNKQTEKQRSTLSAVAEVLSFTHYVSLRQSIQTRARQPDAPLKHLVMGFSSLTQAFPPQGADITWQTPAQARQELFTQTPNAAFINTLQEGKVSERSIVFEMCEEGIDVRDFELNMKAWRFDDQQRVRSHDPPLHRYPVIRASH